MYCLLYIVYCLVSTVCCLLSTFCCLLSTVYSILSTVFSWIFTELSPRLIQSIGCYVQLSGFMSVPLGGTRNGMDYRLLAKERIAKIAKQGTLFFKILKTFWVLTFLGFLVLSWWTSLLCIVGELAGGGSLAVGAVDVSDMWHVTQYMWHVTYAIRRLIYFLTFFWYRYYYRNT